MFFYEPKDLKTNMSVLKKSGSLFVASLLLIVLLVGVYVLNKKNASTTLNSSDSDFAVEQIENITKLFLADKSNQQVTLSKNSDGIWMVNNSFPAREDAVSNLLYTIQNMSVKAPVAKAAHNNIVKQIAAKHTKVEVYMNRDAAPSKIFYVSIPNQEHTGTYMLKEGSSVPFLMHLEGFRGYLTTRFFTNPKEWRSTNIFNYGYGDLESLQVNYKGEPNESFGIVKNQQNGVVQYALTNQNNEVVQNFDTLAVLQYLKLYEKIHFEGFVENKSEQFIDSVRLQEPFATYKTVDVNGVTKQVDCYLKAAPEGGMDFEYNEIEFDLDRFYGIINQQDLVVLQYFVFDPLKRKQSSFVQQ